ncbi:MAG: large repetitive protein [Actinoplanes sp.]|jgi:titin|nr:large repetitive protein [Actinoplanes sp.]
MGRRRVRKGVAAAAAVLGTAGAVLLPSFPALAAIGSSDTWKDSSRVLAETVPVGVCGIRFILRGGAGSALGDAGNSGVVVFTMPTTPGTDFRVSVGAVGSTSTGAAIGPQIGGFGGERGERAMTGSPGPGGGGATVLRYDGRIVAVAGGGSGARTRGANFLAAGLSATVNGTYGVRASGQATAEYNTPCSPPDVPGGLSVAVSGDTQVTIGFCPVRSGFPIGYEARLDRGPWTAFDAAPTGRKRRACDEIGGTLAVLAPGRTHVFRVRARYAGLTTPPSGSGTAASLFMPALAPGQPTNVRAVVGDRAVALTFTAPADGGSAISAYQYRIGKGDWTELARSGVITGLTVRPAVYHVQLRAVNRVKPGPAAAPIVFAAESVPRAPSGLTATPSKGRAVVYFAPGPATSKEANRYEVSIDGGATWTVSPTVRIPAAGRSLTINGLRNGSSYPVRLRAANSHGPGPQSENLTVTLAAVGPAAPTGLIAVAGDRSATLTFAAPADGGGRPIAGYEYSRGGDWRPLAVTVAGGLRTGVIHGLSPTKTYDLQVRAVNEVGGGDPSAIASVIAVGSPLAPSHLSVAAGNEQATLILEAGAGTGPVVTGWEVSVDDGIWMGLDTTADQRGVIRGDVTELTNGRPAELRVRGLNRVGAGVPSAAVVAHPVAGRPSVPLTFAARAGTGGAVLSFARPADDGGAPIIRYEVSTGDNHWAPIDVIADGTDRKGTLSLLIGGTAYAIRVRAVNLAGAGPATAAVAVTPAATVLRVAEPAVPTGLAVTAADGSLAVRFQPTADTDRTAAAYEVSTDDGSTWSRLESARTGGTVVGKVDGLDNGRPYRVRVRAVQNAIASAPSKAVTAAPDPGPDAVAAAVPSDYSNISVGDNPNLPRTGGGLLPIGVFLVASGAGLVILGHKRRRTTA